VARNFLQIDDTALAGMALALKKVDKEAKQEWAKAMRSTGTRVWSSAISNRKYLAQDRLFGRAAVRWTQGGRGTATVVVKPLSGGWEYPGPIDFGAKNPRGRQFPRYNSSGRVVAPAMTPLGSFMGQMALKTTADLIRDAAGVSGG